MYMPPDVSSGGFLIFFVFGKESVIFGKIKISV